ncbi:DUF885 domain-containing protein [Solimicrobium silvestre]|uniref:DUF885 domain-containing protein n=1 Tax=Solimicrobium silvestre TaxID=2099400 RepID=A0A2S9GYP8_9BURK|nr:DUF885 domain-containing protein [Solimicrobium silvestre]PRC92828.1 hypothetical protein S2091_2558 [Solimicrobium silvestre]
MRYSSVSAHAMRSIVLASMALCSPMLSLAASSANSASVPNTSAGAVQSAKLNHAFDQLSQQFLTSLWRISPEMAIGFGKFDNASQLTIPDQHSRDQWNAFAKQWLAKFSAVDASKLPVQQSSDLALIQNFLNGSVWQLTTFREFEWNPSEYNIAGEIDSILNTDYASKAERIHTLIKRLKNVPAYYAAARASIVRPTMEHTQLAIQQAPGALVMLDQVEQEAKAVKLNKLEQSELKERIAEARTAINGYKEWLVELAKNQNPSNTRSFRIGADLYEAKFGFDIQSSFTAKEMFQRAVAAKQAMHQNMDKLADELWPKYMGEQVKPENSLEKIGMVIDKLSANHTTPDKLMSDVRAHIPALESWITSHDLLDLDPSKPLVIRETPEYQRGVTMASLDSAQPFTPTRDTYYNVTPITDKTPEQTESLLREYNHWVLQILSIHEAVPGHYVQLLHANRSPSIIKSLFGNGAMIEGWAVYGERMMLESGYGDNAPEMWLMYSKWNLRSICNTILDYSVHVLGMSQEDAMHLLTKEAFQSEAEAAGKWRRVQLTSVQLDSYFSGFSEIMALREERKQALGDKFDLKQFHEQFLSYGSAPVRMIRGFMEKN